MQDNDFEKALSLIESIDTDLRKVGTQKLYHLYKNGCEAAGWELVHYHRDENIITGLTNQEAANLLMSDVKKNLNPFAALSLYYYYYEWVGADVVCSMLTLVKDNSAEAQEILSRV